MCVQNIYLRTVLNTPLNVSKNITYDFIGAQVLLELLLVTLLTVSAVPILDHKLRLFLPIVYIDHRLAIPLVEWHKGRFLHPHIIFLLKSVL